MQDWFTAGELARRRLPGLPTAKDKVRDFAERKNWQSADGEGTNWRFRQGRGGGIEYHWALLPRDAQVALAMKLAAEGAQEPSPAPLPQVGEGSAQEAKRAAAWAWFARLPEKKRAVARTRLAALDAMDALVQAGLETVVAAMAIAREHDVSVSTLYRWREAVALLDRPDWLPALAPRHCGKVETAACTPEAWDFIRADYLRLEAPNFTDCYRRLQAAAAAQGWSIPSRSTLERRMEAIPAEVRTLARSGVEALKRMYPAQQRSRAHFHALEAVNADGHKWDVFVRWPDGTIGRPNMVAIQDLYSGMILSWRVDVTANAAAVRLAIGDMVEEFGIPRLCYLDNGRDFASKWITGGTPNRYRFKVRDDEPQGLLTQLGVEVHWTTPYSGQSKPIERAFRDFAQGIAKHPAFAGAYVGNSPMAKPENYGNAAVPLEQFLAVIGAGIAEHNARVGRRSEVCRGKFSFAQVFAESYASAPVMKATAEQKRLWLLAAEAIRVDARDGAITLEGNRFWHEDLVALRGQRVTVRFDPEALQEPLAVYRSDGGFVCTAPCVAAAGFDDIHAAQAHGRARKGWLRAQKDMLAAQQVMSLATLATLLPEADAPAPLPQTKVVRPFIVAGNAAVARKPAAEPDNLEWLEEANRQRRENAHLRLIEAWTDEG